MLRISKFPQLRVVAWTVGTYPLPCNLGHATANPIWRSVPLAGTGVRLSAFYGVPKHLSHRGHQKCPRVGSLLAHAHGAIETVLWDRMYWQYAPPRTQATLKAFHCSTEAICSRNRDCVVRMKNKGHWKWPSCHSSWKMDMSWLFLAPLFWPYVKDAQD